MTFSVAIAGASGYAGGELLRILADHPDFDVTTVTAHSQVGQQVTSAHPHLRSYRGLTFKETSTEVLSGHDVVFLALPHGSSGAVADALDPDTLVVDAGADHRLTSAADWDAFYGGHWHGAWAYGLPELVRAPGGILKQRTELVGAKRIAAPGCNVTAVTLGLAPGIAAGVIDPGDIVAVLAVGPSGAGRSLKPNLLASEILGSASAYGVGGVHRHTPEIRQNLALGVSAGTLVQVSMTPVLVPMARGILATSTARITSGTSLDSIRGAWEDAYADEPFVQLLPAGEFPRTSDVLGANTALIGLAIDENAGRVVAVSAIDNLTKGTAGAAVQSVNIALGLPETRGLSLNGVAP